MCTWGPRGSFPLRQARDNFQEDGESNSSVDFELQKPSQEQTIDLHLARFIQSPSLSASSFPMVFNYSDSPSTCPGSPLTFSPSPSVASPQACLGCIGVISRFNESQLLDWSRDEGAAEEKPDENGSAGKATRNASKQVTKMLIKVDLRCERSCKKIKETLCKFPREIEKEIYDRKQNMVLSTVVCCPEKIRDKICRKGGNTVESVEILPRPKCENH